MFKKWFWVRALVTLVLIGLLAVGGYIAYRTGWWQGHAAGQLAAEGTESAPMGPGLGYRGTPFGFMPFRPFGGARIVFTLAFGLFFFAMIGKLIRFAIWGPAILYAMKRGGPTHWRHYHRRWPHHHGPMHRGPMPPWCWGWEESSEEEGSESETDAE